MPQIKAKQFLSIIRERTSNNRNLHNQVQSEDEMLLSLLEGNINQNAGNGGRRFRRKRFAKVMRMDTYLFVYYMLYYLVMAIISFVLFFTLGYAYESQFSFDAQLQFWYEIQQAVLVFSGVIVFFIARHSYKHQYVNFKVKKGCCSCCVKLVQAPQQTYHKLWIIFIDLTNIGNGLFAAIVYILNFNEIQTNLKEMKLIRMVVPAIAILDILVVFRMIGFIHLFVTIPYLNKNNILDRNKINGIEHKFPVITLKQYRKQIKHQRSQSVDSLISEQTCAICCEELKPNDYIVVLPCNVKHYFTKHCIAKWLEENNTCPLCKENVCYGGVLTSNNDSTLYNDTGSPLLSRENSNVSGIRYNLFASQAQQQQQNISQTSSPQRLGRNQNIVSFVHVGDSSNTTTPNNRQSNRQNNNSNSDLLQSRSSRRIRMTNISRQNTANDLANDLSQII
eukprot:403361895